MADQAESQRLESSYEPNSALISKSRQGTTPGLLRINSDDISGNQSAIDRFGSSLEPGINQNMTLDNIKNTHGLLEKHYSGEDQQNRGGEEQDVRKRFLDAQVEKIMAKNHSRHNSEPARKYRKTGI